MQSALAAGAAGVLGLPAAQAKATSDRKISPRPILLIAGANAHSRYYSEDVYRAAADPKQRLIVPDADHVDLYDRLDKIPFIDIERFFKNALK
jgi:uncharacterized protein